jgi:hypothetical protein
VPRRLYSQISTTRAMRNPFILSYSDIIKEQERNVVNLIRIKQNAIANGLTNLEGMTYKIQVAERILKLLKMSRRERQADLFELNTQLNHA